MHFIVNIYLSANIFFKSKLNYVYICSEHPDVVSIFPNKGKKLHTTRSWDFMLLENNGVIHSSSAWGKGRFGEDIIIANLDTGIYTIYLFIIQLFVNVIYWRRVSLIYLGFLIIN